MKRLIILLLPILTMAQIEFSGNLSPKAQFYLDSLHTHIDLPFRIAEFEVGTYLDDFDLKSNIAIETRWDSMRTPTLELRELTISWYPSFGEIVLGKQIIAWGVADGNNPTDNLQPYNFYYLFSTGSDRKNGSLALNSSFYLSDFLIQAVILPYHESNTMIKSTDPFPENLRPKRDFAEDEIYSIEKADELELGLRVRWSGSDTDISASYLRAHDRTPSPYRFLLVAPNGKDGLKFEIPSMLGYRKTTVYGLDGVTFLGDFAFRFEGAYFKTQNTGDAQYELDANYYQTVFQIEYSTPWGITITTQYIQSETLNLDYENHVLPTSLGEIIPFDIESTFMPGMGTPFAMITHKSLMFMSSTELFDNTLEIGVASLFDLEEPGSMVNFNTQYLLTEQLEVGLSASIFNGEDTAENNFYAMESFSNVGLNLSWSF